MLSGQSQRLSAAHLQLFVAILVRNEKVFKQFKGRVTVEHFEQEHYRLVYRVLLDFHAVHAKLPSRPELKAEIGSLLELDDQLLSQQSYNDLYDFIKYTFSPETFSDCSPTSPELEKYARNAGRRLLLQSMQEQIKTKINEISIDDLPVFLQQAKNSFEIIKRSTATTDRNDTFDDGWDRRKPKVIYTTGLAFFDRFMDGGASRDEVYGLMAPYGTCKTTLAVMLWCKAAEQCYQATLEDNWDKRIGVSVLVTYEAPKNPEILHRALMYSATIKRGSLTRMGMDGMSALSSNADAPEDYEKAKFEQQIKDGLFIPEVQRAQQKIVWLNKHTICLDFSGSDDKFPTAGNGGTDEIVERINNELAIRGNKHYVKNVIIDYLGLMVDRNTSKTVKNVKVPAEDHKTYQAAAGEISLKIAKPYECHVWILHQLSGAANAFLNPTKILHHTDAKGSKSFAENLDFCFVIGNLNNESMGQLACTKQRRFRKLPATVIRVEGEYNSVLSLDNYLIDDKGKMVDKATLTSAGITTNMQMFNDITQNVTENEDLGNDIDQSEE
jgi:replicative DNA helicase